MIKWVPWLPLRNKEIAFLIGRMFMSCLFHSHVNKEYYFFDPIGGKVVYKFRCLDCGSKWMANGRFNLFRVSLR
jgi:hypothetical protein